MGSAAIAVFGSSEPVPGDSAYRQACRLGTELALAGHVVLTGGYGGVMEAASRGAKEAGGATVGITCSLFAHRDPNPWVDEAIFTPNLHERTRELIDRAGGFVVLPGKAGTLAELSFLWALHRADTLGLRPVVLLGSPWPGLLQYLSDGGLLDPREVSMAHLASSPKQAVGLLRQVHSGDTTRR
ncbi:LOG family protein [bacterium]|nr:LOG family protein [bacterium]